MAMLPRVRYVNLHYNDGVYEIRHGDRVLGRAEKRVQTYNLRRSVTDRSWEAYDENLPSSRVRASTRAEAVPDLLTYLGMDKECRP